MRLLIIDDDATLRAIVKSKLTNAGHTILEAGDGASGWRILQTAVIDFLLVDLGLPDMDGRALIKRARCNPRTQQLPIVVITGREDREAIDDAFEIGANYFLTKPINWSLFHYQINYVMRMAETERQAQRAHIASQAESRLKDTIIGRLNYVMRPMASSIVAASDKVMSEFGHAAPNDDVKFQLEEIREHAIALVKTLGSMAHFASLMTDSINVNQCRISLADLLGEVMQALDSYWASAAFQVEMPEHPLWLYCDRDQLSWALVNLLDNAFRFSPADRSVRLSVTQPDDGSINFTVDDEGPGIPPQQLRRLLAPMAVINEADHVAHNVNGFGLASAKFIVEAHGGKLTIQSAVGRGTSASIHLPSHLVATLEADADAA